MDQTFHKVDMSMEPRSLELDSYFIERLDQAPFEDKVLIRKHGHIVHDKFCDKVFQYIYN